MVGIAYDVRVGGKSGESSEDAPATSCLLKQRSGQANSLHHGERY